VTFHCPICGTSFRKTLAMSGTAVGQRLDLRSEGFIESPARLPRCPKCHLIFFRQFAPRDLKKLKQFVPSAEYVALTRDDHSPHYLAATLMTQLGADAYDLALACLSAAWDREGGRNARWRFYVKEGEELMGIFPPIISQHPAANLGIAGVESRLLQAGDQQFVFMHFTRDFDIGEHSHAAQWGAVLDGEAELVIHGTPRTMRRGDTYFIPAGVRHSARIIRGYTDLTLFDQRDRYAAQAPPR
jgi:quercetin dioxygenase-like cupin family protein